MTHASGYALLVSSLVTLVSTWQVEAPRPASAEPSRAELDAIWTDLAGTDARKAYQGICTLVRWPGPGVALLKEHLKPAPRGDAERIARLIADLDSEQFAVRDRATQSLEQLQELAKPALEKVLKGSPSVEVRQRVEGLLEKLDWPSSSPERLRQLRAAEALEHMGTAEARQLFELLATGAPEALLTLEARKSLERLKKRDSGRP